MKKLILVLLFSVIGSANAANRVSLTKVFFAVDQDTLDSTAKSNLDLNLKILRETNSLIVLDGHCDSRGSSEYNFSLGQRRATAVRKYYLAHGIPAARLITVSFGKEEQLGLWDETTPVDLSINRVVGTTILVI